MTDKTIKHKLDIGINADDYVTIGIFIFLWTKYNLTTAGLGIAIIVMCLMFINEFLD